VLHAAGKRKFNSVRCPLKMTDKDNGERMNAKRLFILALLIGLTVYFAYSRADTRDGLMASATRFFSSSAADEKRLEQMHQELDAKESILAQMDAKIERIRANPPKPRCEGGTAAVSITDDPRPALREEIKALREEIVDLEAGRAE
jgi:hypothetical protein